MPDQTEPALTRRFLLYVPAYNCADKVVPLLQEIPEKYWSLADILVIDNCSSDGTADQVVAANAAGAFPRPVHVIQPTENLDYAGSQKLAYKLALRSPSVQWVIMLHGDGQYATDLLSLLEPYYESDYDIVQGYRSKKVFGSKEETPWTTYSVIKVLNAFESWVLGVPLWEWHSGFVMYATSFLRQIDLNRITRARHIDGHLLFAASAIGGKVKAVPIWKRYRDYPGYHMPGRVLYTFTVFRLIARWRWQKTLGKHRGSVTAESPILELDAYSALYPPTNVGT